VGDWTAGPWIASEADWFGDHNIQSKEGVETDTDHLAIAAVVSNLRPADEVAANAYLISAAPTLAEALARLLPRMGQADHLPDDAVIPVDMTMAEIRQARAALALARGGV